MSLSPIRGKNRQRGGEGNVNGRGGMNFLRGRKGRKFEWEVRPTGKKRGHGRTDYSYSSGGKGCERGGKSSGRERFFPQKGLRCRGGNSFPRGKAEGKNVDDKLPRNASEHLLAQKEKGKIDTKGGGFARQNITRTKEGERPRLLARM